MSKHLFSRVQKCNCSSNIFYRYRSNFHSSLEDHTKLSYLYSKKIGDGIKENEKCIKKRTASNAAPVFTQ